MSARSRPIAAGERVVSRFLFFFCGALTFAALAWANSALFGYRFLEKFPPDATLEGLVRTAGCLAVGVVLALALREEQQPRDYADRLLSGTGFGVAYLISLAMLLFTGAIMLLRPTALLAFVEELGPLGIFQEVSIAAAVALVLLAARRLRGRSVGAIGPLPGSLLAAGMGGALFLLLMEEMSWGQHLVGWSSPELFSANIQHETNLHNFFTNRFEFVYYSAAVLIFIVLPFAWPRQGPRWVEAAGFYVPPRAFAVVALPIAAYLYEIWNIVPMQAAFFLALAMAALLALEAGRTGAFAAFPVLVMAMAVLACQLVFLATGDGLAVSYEIEEMRETAISWLILVYAFWLFAKAAPMRRPAIPHEIS